MKEFIFIVQLLFPDGSGPPPKSTPVPTMVECLSAVATQHSILAEQNADFTVMAGCVQVSKKADPS